MAFVAATLAHFGLLVHGKPVKRSVRIADQHESPPGTLAIRFMGADTPETHVECKNDDGSSVFYSQGRPGEIAAEKPRREPVIAPATVGQGV